MQGNLITCFNIKCGIYKIFMSKATDYRFFYLYKISEFYS